MIPRLSFLGLHYIVLHIKMHIFTYESARIHTSYTESLASCSNDYEQVYMAVFMQNCKINHVPICKTSLLCSHPKSKSMPGLAKGTTSPDHKQPMALVLQMIKPALPLTHLQVLGLTRCKAQKQTPLGAGEFTWSVVEKDTSSWHRLIDAIPEWFCKG